MKINIVRLSSAILLLQLPAMCQLSSSAYRALGQPDMRQNGINQVNAAGLNGPMAVALDERDGGLHLYIADTNNNRTLAWRDARTYQAGDPPALILGQPTSYNSGYLGIGEKGLAAPVSLAVDPTNGNLYVADLLNHRVLRFLRPFANELRVEPDAVYGQPAFSSRSANPKGITASSMKEPRAVAFDSAGNLWVADAGNNRVLRFSAATLDAPNPSADLVIGQKDFNSGSANRGSSTISASGFDSPTGLAFDGQNNLFVSDTNNARVLKFSSLAASAPPATEVFGQARFDSKVVLADASNLSISRPSGLSLDGNGNLYVAVPADNRIMVFTPGAPVGTGARSVLGQASFTSTTANAGVFPQASPNTLYGVSDVKADAAGNLYAADFGNNRVLCFPAKSKAATQVWGQNDFTANGMNQIKPGSINAPYKMAVDYSQTPFALYISDTNNHRILVWKDAVRFRTGDPADMVIGQPDFRTAVPNVDTRGLATPSQTSLSSPKGIALDQSGNLYVADSGNHRVLRYPRPVNQTGRVEPDVVIGQPDFTSALSAMVSSSSLHSPSGIAIGPDGDIFVSDSGNHRVLEFPAGSGNGAVAIRVYGQPGFNNSSLPSAVSSQTLTAPQGIAVDAAANLYVADTGANRVLIFANTKDAPAAGTAASIVLGNDDFETTAAAGSGAARFHSPVDVALDSLEQIYVSDNGNNRVMVFPSLIFLPIAAATATDVVGQRDLSGSGPNWNSGDGLATSAGLYSPLGVYVDRRDTLYVGDAGNNRVVHFLRSISVAHAANAQASSLGRGGLASLSGEWLSDEERSVNAPPLQASLANREVVFNDDLRAPLSSASPSQIKFQVPWAAPIGSPRIAVRMADTGELLAGTVYPVTTYSPGLFNGQEVKILNQDGSINSASTPTLKGTVIQLSGTGQGPVSPAVPDGEAAPGDGAVNTIAVPTSDGLTCLTRQPSVCVAVGNAFGEVLFSGLAPGEAGVWQLKVRIPFSAPSGNSVNVRAVINGIPSNIVTIAIK